MKQDCFGYEFGGCRVLNENVCEKCGNCPFYKTREQLSLEKARTFRRLQKLYVDVDILRLMCKHRKEVV